MATRARAYAGVGGGTCGGRGGVVGPGKVLISLSCVAKRKGCATTEEGFEAKN